jgi:hypothetical protein
MGATEAPPNHETRVYFLKNIRSVMDKLHIRGWEALLCVLRCVLWSDEVHGTRAEAAHVAVDVTSG